MDGALDKDTTTAAAATVPAPKTDGGVDSTKQSSTVPPTPPIQGAEGNEDEASLPKENPFDQYYSQLTHQQNMLQDSVRVTAYQRAILENAADFKVRPCPAAWIRSTCWSGLMFTLSGRLQRSSIVCSMVSVNYPTHVRSLVPEYQLPLLVAHTAVTALCVVAETSTRMLCVATRYLEAARRISEPVSPKRRRLQFDLSNMLQNQTRDRTTTSLVCYLWPRRR